LSWTYNHGTSPRLCRRIDAPTDDFSNDDYGLLNDYDYDKGWNDQHSAPLYAPLHPKNPSLYHIHHTTVSTNPSGLANSRNTSTHLTTTSLHSLLLPPLRTLFPYHLYPHVHFPTLSVSCIQHPQTCLEHSSLPPQNTPLALHCPQRSQCFARLLLKPGRTGSRPCWSNFRIFKSPSCHMSQCSSCPRPPGALPRRSTFTPLPVHVRNSTDSTRHTIPISYRRFIKYSHQ
jgi:hypothetical protein